MYRYRYRAAVLINVNERFQSDADVWNTGGPSGHESVVLHA